MVYVHLLCSIRVAAATSIYIHQKYIKIQKLTPKTSLTGYIDYVHYKSATQILQTDPCKSGMWAVLSYLFEKYQ